MKTDGNQPAFPCDSDATVISEDGKRSILKLRNPGMTLRQWYAGMAMQRLLTTDGYGSFPMGLLRNMAFAIADAMLDEPESKAD